VCGEICGNSLISVTEACDDGGTVPGDGCNAGCQIEPGWECVGEPSVCTYCGDDVIEGTEECDDGDTTPGDGCDASCEIEPGWTCEGEPSVCTPLTVPSISFGGLALLAGLVLGSVAWVRRRL
jgi:cysteine-rich repeat protein